MPVLLLLAVAAVGVALLVRRDPALAGPGGATGEGAASAAAVIHSRPAVNSLPEQAVTVGPTIDRGDAIPYVIDRHPRSTGEDLDVVRLGRPAGLSPRLVKPPPPAPALDPVAARAITAYATQAVSEEVGGGALSVLSAPLKLAALLSGQKSVDPVSTLIAKEVEFAAQIPNLVATINDPTPSQQAFAALPVETQKTIVDGQAPGATAEETAAAIQAWSEVPHYGTKQLDVDGETITIGGVGGVYGGTRYRYAPFEEP